MILYKYYPPNDYSYRSLARRGIWCHNPERMNDPFDGLGQSDRTFTKKQLESYREILRSSKDTRISKISLQPDEHISNRINDHRKQILSKIAFGALSEVPDDILMWSHYANGHKGFVIGIEIEKVDHHLQKVQYPKSLPTLDISIYAENQVGNYDRTDEIFKDISVKSHHWSYEKEWRIWRKSPMYYHYNQSEIKVIYFGVRTEDDVKKTVLKLVENIDDPIPIYDMEFNENPLGLKY